MAKKIVGIGIVIAAAAICIAAVVASQDKGTTGSVSGVAVASSTDAAHSSEQGPQDANNNNQKPTSMPSAATTKLSSQTTKPANAERYENKSTGKGLAAIKYAADTKKYLFIFFYKNEDQQIRDMRKVFDAAMKKVADKAESVFVNISDSLEKELVNKFGLSRAPMPLVLVLAPNGAVTGGFPMKFDEKQLVDAFATPCMEKCLKSLQEGKLIFLCVQGKTTKSNNVAMQGVRDFKADEKYGQFTEIVTMDPNDSAETKSMKQLQIDPNTAEATTLFLAPPGRVIAKFEGATNKNTLVATIQRAMSSCNPSSGCCPPKK